MKKFFAIFFIFLSGCNGKKEIDMTLEKYLSTAMLAASTPRMSIYHPINDLQNQRIEFENTTYYFSCKVVHDKIVDRMKILEAGFLLFATNDETSSSTKTMAEALAYLYDVKSDSRCKRRR